MRDELEVEDAQLRVEAKERALKEEEALAHEPPKELGAAADEDAALQAAKDNLEARAPDEEGATEETPAKEGETPPAAPEPPKTLKVGEEEVPLEEVIAGYEKSKHAGRWQKEAQQTLRKAQEKEEGAKLVIEHLMKDPLAAFRELLAGKVGERQAHERTRKAAEDFLLQVLEEEALGPEAREVRAERRAMERERAELERRRRESLAAEEQAEAERIAEHFQKKITEAVAASGLPKTQKVYEQVAREMIEAAEAGISLTPEEAIATVKEEREKELAQLLETLPPAELIKKFPEQARAIQKHAADEARAKLAQAVKPGTSAAASPPRPKRDAAKVLAASEVRGFLREGLFEQ